VTRAALIVVLLGLVACSSGKPAFSAGRRIYAIEGGDEPGFHFTRSLEYLDVLLR
jgi:hypothetical protein